VQVRRSKDTVLKVISWLRSKPKRGDSPATFADAWRLDETGASHALGRGANPEPRPNPEPRQQRPPRPPVEPPNSDLRQQRPTRPAEPRQHRESPPIATSRPARDARIVQELRPKSVPPRVIQELRPTPSPKPAPESRLLDEIQELRRTTEPRRVAREPRPAKPQTVSLEGTLAAAGLVKSFGGRRVVNDVTIGLRRGEAVGLLGPNGAGKTTVFYMIVGLIQADAGVIMLDGHDVTGLPMYRRARLGIGYLPQEPSIFRGMSVEDNIRSVLEAVESDRSRREEELDMLLEEFNIDRVRHSPAIALSGGERRRVEIARALASRPSFMLLDEPFAGIDPIAVGDIQELVRHLTRRGIGVLITDHNVRETLGLVDRAYIVHSGSILMEGDPDQIVQSEKVRRVYLGEEFRL
jgi:lipopolysaccharide export system ATP-binding protein